MHKTAQEKLAVAALAEAYHGDWNSLGEQDQTDFLNLVEQFAEVLQSPSIRKALTQATMDRMTIASGSLLARMKIPDEQLVDGLVSALLTPGYRSRWAQRK